MSVVILDCRRYGVFGPQPVRLVLVRDRDTGPMLALITTDLAATTADRVARYAAGTWSPSMPYLFQGASAPRTGR